MSDGEAGRSAPGALLIAEGGAGRHALDAEAILGRDAAADVVVADAAASWRHARIRRRGTEYVLEDLGSRNGTWVNGRRVTGPQVLRSGDRLRLGASRFRFLAASPPPPPVAGVPVVTVEEGRRARDVAAIVSTPYFAQLRRAARRRPAGPGQG